MKKYVSFWLALDFIKASVSRLLAIRPSGTAFHLQEAGRLSTLDLNGPYDAFKRTHIGIPCSQPTFNGHLFWLYGLKQVCFNPAKMCFVPRVFAIEGASPAVAREQNDYLIALDQISRGTTSLGCRTTLVSGRLLAIEKCLFYLYSGRCFRAGKAITKNALAVILG